VGGSAWGDFVLMLADTDQSPPPAAGTWVTARVRSCVGPVPLPAIRTLDWIFAADTSLCSEATEVSAQAP
jgi:hypothetical protein